MDSISAGKISLPVGTAWPLGLTRTPVDVTGHLGRHDVKEEVGLMDERASEKRKVDDFSSLYSLDTPGQPQAPVSHAPSSGTPPRTLQDHTSE